MGKTNKRNIKVTKSGKVLERREPTETCNAIVGEEYCTALAGEGTDHVGTGRCKLHGGFSKGRPKRNFVPSEYLSGQLVKTFEEASEFDPTTLTNLDNEINIVRSSLYKYFKDQEENKGEIKSNTVKQYLDTLVKLVDTKNKWEGKVREKHIPTQMVVYFANRMTEILVSRIQDPLPTAKDLLQQIAADMKKIETEQFATADESAQ